MLPIFQASPQSFMRMDGQKTRSFQGIGHQLRAILLYKGVGADQRDLGKLMCTAQVVRKTSKRKINSSFSSGDRIWCSDCSAWRMENSGRSYQCLNNWREGAKRTDPGSFQWCSVPGQEATGTNWKTEGSLQPSGSTSVLWEWQSTSTGCPEAGGLCLGDLQKPPGHEPEQTAWNWCACLSRSWIRQPPEAPGCPQSFCNIVTRIRYKHPSNAHIKPIPKSTYTTSGLHRRTWIIC